MQEDHMISRAIRARYLRLNALAVPSVAAPPRWDGCGLAKEIVFDDCPQRPESVPPANFFAFGIRAAVVANADLVDHHVELCHLGGDLGLETKAVFLNRD